MDSPAWMHSPARRSAPFALCAILTHIERLSDCFGFFDVRISCRCGACRSIDAHELAQRVRCSQCGKKGAAQVVAVAQQRPRGVPKNSH